MVRVQNFWVLGLELAVQDLGLRVEGVRRDCTCRLSGLLKGLRKYQRPKGM